MDSCHSLSSASETVATGSDLCYKGIAKSGEIPTTKAVELTNLVGGCFGYASYKVANGIATGFQKMGHGIYGGAKSAAAECRKGAGSTAKYVKENWDRLLAYFIGWAVIILCAGFMNGYNVGGLQGISVGFKAVSLPMTIGMGCGFAFGGIIGIFVVRVFNPIKAGKNKPDHPIDKSSAWGYLNTWFNSISDFGTRQIMIAVAVAVILALATRYPYAGGGLFGFFVGNQLITNLGYNKRLGPSAPNHLKTLQDELSRVKKKFNKEKGKIESSDLQNYEEQIGNLTKELELAKRKFGENAPENSVQLMQQELDLFGEEVKRVGKELDRKQLKVMESQMRELQEKIEQARNNLSEDDKEED